MRTPTRTHRRLRVLLGVLTGAAALLAGCSTADDAATSRSAPAADSSPTSPSSSPPSSGTGRARVVGAGPDMAVEVPDGWLVLRSPSPLRGLDQSWVCLTPPGRPLLPCTALRLEWGEEVTGPGDDGDYRPGVPAGWRDGSDTVICPRGRDADMQIIRPTTPPTDSAARSVGGHAAAWDRWRESCADGTRFDPQVWYVEDVGVLVRDLTGHLATDAVLAGARFRADGDAVPSAATYERVRVTAIDARHATVRRRGTARRVDLSDAACTGWRSVPGEVLAPVVPCRRLAGLVEDDRGFVAVLWREADGAVSQVSPALDAWSPAP